jgi:DNA-binding GntR family transcriptional regulator
MTADTKVTVGPPEAVLSFKMQAYLALKETISRMDIYGQRGDILIDDREICETLGISRTPVREALVRLEHEGFIRSVPRRGILVVRKTRRQIAEMIVVWAALAGMAARLFAEHATDEEIDTLCRAFHGPDAPADGGIELHQSFIRSSRCALIGELTGNFGVHIRGICKLTLHEAGGEDTSVLVQREILEAIRTRDADRAEDLIRRHNLELAAHVERNCTFLD